MKTMTRGPVRYSPGVLFLCQWPYRALPRKTETSYYSFRARFFFILASFIFTHSLTKIFYDYGLCFMDTKMGKMFIQCNSWYNLKKRKKKHLSYPMLAAKNSFKLSPWFLPLRHRFLSGCSWTTDLLEAAHTLAGSSADSGQNINYFDVWCFTGDNVYCNILRKRC